MRVDLYTKAVLTVIAACLVWMCASQANLLPVVVAQGPASKIPVVQSIQPVVIMGWNNGTGNPLSYNARPFPVVLAGYRNAVDVDGAQNLPLPVREPK